MKIKDDRNDEQRDTHRYLVIGTDTFLSGWGEANGGNSYAAWACEGPEAARTVRERIRARGEMRRVRVVYSSPSNPYRPNPRTCKHLHIYVARD